MEKIKMTTPLVEMDGDEMTRILWKIIKDELIYPFVDLKSEYYDLGLEHRNETDDKVTTDETVFSITLKVKIEVNDDYILDNPDWLLQDAVAQDEYNYYASLLEDNN